MSVKQPKLVSIIGGSGFVGTQLVQALARAGYRIRVGVRRPDLAGHLRPLGAVGQIQPMQVNVRDFDSVASGVEGAQIVINLAAIGVEKGKQQFFGINARGAGRVAQAAKKAGVETFVQMSALGAGAEAPSEFLRSRAKGEIEVKVALPEAHILRPSIIFGPDDEFFNRFGMLARMLPFLPVINGDTRFQPVFVGDVVDAVMAAAQGKAEAGKTYELGGNEIVTMREIMQIVNKVTNRENMLLDIPTGLAKFMAGFAQLLPSPLLTTDQVDSLGHDNVVSEQAIKNNLTLQALGITATTMDEILPDYMWRFRKRGEFEQVKT